MIAKQSEEQLNTKATPSLICYLSDVDDTACNSSSLNCSTLLAILGRELNPLSLCSVSCALTRLAQPRTRASTSETVKPKN